MLVAAETAEGQYEWEDWDYYTILGLATSDADDDGSSSNMNYTPKDIRKAYRKQAQMWHPDKILHRQQQQDENNTANKDGTTTTTSTTASASQLEESNARFARIAEAYKVLSNEEEKQAYDLYLRRQQQQLTKQQQYLHEQNQRRQEQQYKYESKDEERMDPFRMFQEFFFGEEDEEDDPYFQQHFTRPYQHWRHAVEGHAPDRAQQSQERFTNGRDEIVRLLEMTGFYTPDGVYTRVMALDYVVQGPDMYRPLMHEPFFVQDGLFEYRNDPLSVRDESTPHHILDPSVLWPGVRMVAGSRMRNGGYVAEISLSCEISVSYYSFLASGDSDSETEAEQLWTLEDDPNFVHTSPYTDKSDCHLEFVGSNLVLTAGTHQQVTLWRSGNCRPVSEMYDDDLETSYVSRLDDDGSLVVYRFEPISFQTLWLSRLWEESMLLSFSASAPSLRKAIINLVPAPVWTVFWSVMVGGRVWRVSSSRMVRAVCQSATGSPAGCSRGGRRLIQLFRDSKHMFQRIITFFDRLVDEILM